MKYLLLSSRPSSRGSALMELLIAIMLSGAAMAGVARLMASAARQARLLDEAAVARREVAGAMEDVMARPWAELEAAETIQLPVSPLARAALADATLRVTVGPAQDDPEAQARRIAIEIRWTAPTGRPAAPARLVAWRYANKERQQ